MRRGLALVELMITLALLGMVLAAALRFMDVQNRMVGVGVSQAELMRNLMHTVSVLRHDLRTTATNLAPGQPFVVFAGPDVVAVNADHATNVANDPFAVYYDPNAPHGSVSAFRAMEATTIPGTGFTYPDSTYRVAGGAVGSAETLIFGFVDDTTTAAAGDFVLRRQVNAGPPEVVARHLRRLDDGPFFEYLAVGGEGSVQTIAGHRLPLAHTVPVHLSPADTMPFALIDSIRGIRVRLEASNARPDDAATTRSLEVVIGLPNAGLVRRRSCGSPPIFGSGVAATPRLVDGVPEIELAWAPAVDETRGEEDVIRYVIWREVTGVPAPDEPFVSIPAGSPVYSFVDQEVESGDRYVYRIAAQDCTPALSSRASATVTAP